MNILLLGPPGAGKGTQAEFLSKHLDIPPISTGEMLRAAAAAGTPLGLKAKALMGSGALLPDSLIIELVQERIQKADCTKGFLLDGFPRTLPQASALEQAGVRIDLVLAFAVPDAVLIERLSGRRVHMASGRVYHLISKPPRQADLDDITGEPLVQREDDQEATVKKRLQIYHEQTEPLCDYYQARSKEGKTGFHYENIDASQTVSVIREQILQAVTNLV